MTAETKPVIQLVLNYLSIRDRSRHEIALYLEKKGVDQQVTEEVFEYLDAHQLIDDYHFGQQWAQSRARRQKGDRKITFELSRKGLNKQQIADILGEIDKDEWIHSMEALVEKKRNKLTGLNDYQKKAKIYQLLSQQGFSAKLIDAFLRRRVE